MKRVLVAEDDELNKIVISEMLSMLDPELEVTVVNDGVEAFEKLQQENFDLLLTDIDMPNMDGRTLLKKIKNVLKKDIPVVSVTAFAVTGDRERLLMDGFDDYISKPLDMEELERVLKKFLP